MLIYNCLAIVNILKKDNTNKVENEEAVDQDHLKETSSEKDKIAAMIIELHHIKHTINQETIALIIEMSSFISLKDIKE